MFLRATVSTRSYLAQEEATTINYTFIMCGFPFIFSYAAPASRVLRETHTPRSQGLLHDIRLFFCKIQFSSFPLVILGPSPAVLFSIQHPSKRNAHTAVTPETLQTPSMGKSHRTGHRCAWTSSQKPSGTAASKEIIIWTGLFSKRNYTSYAGGLALFPSYALNLDWV